MNDQQQPTKSGNPKPDLGLKKMRSANLWQQFIRLQWVHKVLDWHVLALLVIVGSSCFAFVACDRKDLANAKGVWGWGGKLGQVFAPIYRPQIEGAQDFMNESPEQSGTESDTVKVERNQ
jgi:hypothetical protein